MPQGWSDTAGIWAAQGPVPAILDRDDGGLVEISTYLRRTAVPRRRIIFPETQDRNGRFWDLEKHFTVMARSQNLLHKESVMEDESEIAVERANKFKTCGESI